MSLFRVGWFSIWPWLGLYGIAAKIAMQLGFKKGTKGSNMIEMLENGSIFTRILGEHFRDHLLKHDIISLIAIL